jgi:RNA polymerase sigma-70 factor (ECF subfamily)
MMRRVHLAQLDGARTLDAGAGEPAPDAVAGVMAADAEFTGFFRAEFGRVVRTVFLIVNDHGRAEEIAQDAFLQLLNNWKKVSAYDQPGAWVRRVAIRMAGRTAKRERMRALLEGRFGPAPPQPPDAPDDEVVRAVGRLPYAQRTAIVLFYFEDRPLSEIAEFLNCAPATARVHLHKARQRLATVLQEEADNVA